MDAEKAFAEAVLEALRNAHTWEEKVRTICRVYHEHREALT